MKSRFWVSFVREALKETGDKYKTDDNGNIIYGLVPKTIYQHEQKTSGHSGIVVEFEVEIADEMFAPLVASAGRAVFPREATDVEAGLRKLQHELE